MTRQADGYPGYPACRHIKTDGELCQSPAMSGRNFCYYHTLYRKRNKPNKKTTKALNVAIIDEEHKWHRVEAIEPFAKRYTLGPLEDSASIQVALSTVLNALADQRMDYHRASTLLYGLQLAQTNLRALRADDGKPAPPQSLTAPEPEAPLAPETAATATTAGTYAQVPPAEELSDAPQR